jgi:hypothetical protein
MKKLLIIIQYYLRGQTTVRWGGGGIGASEWTDAYASTGTPGDLDVDGKYQSGS